SPGFGAGRYVGVMRSSVGTSSFNPRPALGPGATSCSIWISACRFSFNPRPALGPGATFWLTLHFYRHDVSILARLWGRALRSFIVPRINAFVMFQSSPGLVAGRYPCQLRRWVGR